MKKSMLLTLSAAAIAACTFFEPNPILPIGGDYSIVGDTTTRIEKNASKIYKNNHINKAYLSVGDTVLAFKSPKLHTPPGKAVDLSKIKNDKDPELKGKNVSMLVIGGSLSAGVRDGGYFNEGMLTSYPNLVARQMQLKKFELPLFDDSEYNGTGRMSPTNFNPTGGPVKKFKSVKNNLALSIDTDESKSKIKPYKGNPDNFSFPFSSRYDWKGGVQSNMGNLMFKRILKDGENDYKTVLKNRKSDFFILETGMGDSYILGVGTNGFFGASTTVRDNFTNAENLTYEELYNLSSIELQMLRDYFVPNGTKGVLMNLPDFRELPYFLSTDLVKNNTVLYNPSTPFWSNFGVMVSLRPTSKIDSLLSPKVNIALKPGFNKNFPLIWGTDYMIKYTDEEIAYYTGAYNRQLEGFNKKWGYPIVDINSLYHKILVEGGIVAENGVKLTPDNFLSSDLIYPSALGNAAIANEVIKTINAAYKTNIPLIDLREYLTK